MTMRERFARVVGALRENQLLWVEEANAWWQYDALLHKWKPDGGLALRVATELALDEQPDRLPGKFVREALEHAKTDDTLRASILEFDGNDAHLGTPAGVIDLDSHCGLDTTVPWKVSMAAGGVPDPTGPTEWDTFLENAVPSQEVREWLQLWAGSVLHGRSEQHCLLFVYGTAGSGKSTFVEALLAAMGDYGCVLPCDLLMGKGGADAGYWRATLKGKRLAVINETAEGDYWNAPQAKSLTGGDTVHARHPYGRPFAFLPTHKVVVVSNHAPQLSKVDAAFRRRLAVVRFDAKPGHVDRELKRRIRGLTSQILGWAQTGLVALQERFNGDLMASRPQLVLEYTDKYLEEVDLTGEWLADGVERDWNARETIPAVYGHYKEFCASRGRHPKSWTNLKNDLEEREAARMVKSGSTRWVLGIRISPNWDSRDSRDWRDA